MTVTVFFSPSNGRFFSYWQERFGLLQGFLQFKIDKARSE
jgi:hypothetical protein